MRTFLRGFAVVLVFGASALVAVALFGTAVGLMAGMGSVVAWLFAGAVACTAGVWFGGTLWCLATATRPWPAPRPGRGPMWQWLRLVAVLQFGFGVILAVGAATYAVNQLQLQGWRPTGDVAVPLIVLVAAFGLAGQGGLLWCAVRVAYPDVPAAGT